MLPNFLIIGAPRSGTTWIEKNLREHPDVFLPIEKELHFFDQHYEKGIAHYESFFAQSDNKTAIGEATPDYLHGAYSTNDIPTLINRHMPDVKLIASLRNPIERAYSRFLNSKARYDRNKHMTFEEKLRDRPEFIEEGMYFDHLQRYFDLFPPQNMLILLFDDLKKNPQQFMRRIYTFIGVDPEIDTGWESVKVNQATGKGNLARSSFLLFNIARTLTLVGLHSAAQFVRDINSVQEPPISQDMHEMLRSIYEAPNNKLQALIDRDLSNWNAPYEPITQRTN